MKIVAYSLTHSLSLFCCFILLFCCVVVVSVIGVFFLFSLSLNFKFMLGITVDRRIKNCEKGEKLTYIENTEKKSNNAPISSFVLFFFVFFLN